MNRLFVVNKPKGLSSNFFLKKIKRKYGVKKAGFSGTLDPFATGVLIVAFGQFTKLFRFLKKTPKRYRATLWIGAFSETLDNEKIERVDILAPFAPHSIDLVAQSFQGEIEYLPPRFCAKKIDGKRAYELAREGMNFELKKMKSTLYDFRILHYMHPFLTFEVGISEGGYIRSIGYMFARKLGFDGVLTSLQRLSEGEFVYEDEKALDPLLYLDIEDNRYLGNIEDIHLGRVLNVENFEKKDEGVYKLIDRDFLTLIEIKNDGVEYLLNKVKLC